MRECKMGLWVTAIAFRLPQYNTGTIKETINSTKRIWIQVISAVTLAKQQYFASLDDLATIDCFFDYQETRLGSK